MQHRSPRHLLVAAGSVVLTVLLAVPASAQIPIIGKPSPSPTPSPTPTKTSEPKPSSTPSPSGDPTKAPPPPPRDPSGGGSSKGKGSKGSKGSGTSSSTGSGSSGGSGSKTSGSSSSSGGTSETPWGNAIVVGPPSGGEGGFGLEGWAEREKTPPRTTTELLETLAKTYGHAPTVKELSNGFGRFPVLGYTWFQDDYGAARVIGRVSLHAGVDLFAERGTPVAATTDGVIWKYARGGRGGNALWLLGKDGVRYYYGHMDRFAFRPTLGRKLNRGEVFGYVGDTGSAIGTPPHVHFEVNPGGNGTVNPKPYLDSWLDNALDAAKGRLDRDGSATVLPESNAGWQGILELMDIPSAGTPQLWMLGLDPTSSVALANDAIDELLSAQSWAGFQERPLVGATGPELDDPFGVGLDLFSAQQAHPHTHD